MIFKSLPLISFSLLAFIGVIDASQDVPIQPRQFPTEPTDVTTITSPSGVQIRYKEPGQFGVCETTPGVKSYSGYIDLSPDEHVFFWFFESRRDPANDPVTLWLNGGPGSDSLVGLFLENGPCNITKELTSTINPYSWNEISNMLYISQPVGVGFSYRQEQEGSRDPIGMFVNSTVEPANGRYPVGDVTTIDTTDKAAVATYHILQAFYSALPQLDNKVQSKVFNLWTESYGGHYGPAFFKYFSEQNQLIQKGVMNGTFFNMDTLGIGNGLIDEYIQVPWYPEFAMYNTYGIKAYNETVYNYAKFALNKPNGCLAQINFCRANNHSSIADLGFCSEAVGMCRDNVESLYYEFSGRGIYDIRHPFRDPIPPKYFIDYLNQAQIQNAIGVDLNYTSFSNPAVTFAFLQTGDLVYTSFLEDLEQLLEAGVNVALYYGDADYICNWFGGEALSLAVKYEHSAHFAEAGYAPMVVNGVEYGVVRQFGNFSFTRVYEAGHLVPLYQREYLPKALLRVED